PPISPLFPYTTLFRSEHLGRGGIRPKLLDPLAARAHERERLARRCDAGIAFEVEIEDVVERRGAARSRLDLRELKARGRERLERDRKSTRLNSSHRTI